MEDTRTYAFDEPDFGLVISQTGDPGVWAPYRAEDGSLVAVAGRPVFEEAEWETGRAVTGGGGLAAKIIHRGYQQLGAAALERLNGNFAVIAYDAPRRLVHLTTDCCGVMPAFQVETPEGSLYGSHPDVLADAANERHRLDETSLAEFMLSGTVTPPYSYYERLHAADCGTIFTFNLASDRPVRPSKRRYFEFAYRGDSTVREDELADQLGGALRRAVRRRTLPGLGCSAVALSGGLDSRVILAASPNSERTFAFSCYDVPNRELKAAEAIARSLSVRFLPLQREFDYYADHAERGVRISGGMGSFANNHFLGVIPRLKSEGVENLLTGCYCDYLFKALPLNRRRHWLTRRERLAPFRHEFYFDHYPASTALAARARERWEVRIPPELRGLDTVEAVFQVEARRTFPLCYEGDNQQRLVPQRVTGWCPPFVDRELMEVYCRLPYDVKLNRSVFRKVVRGLAPTLRAIPDTNTGAPVDASFLAEWVHISRIRLLRKLPHLFGSSASDESWPNWRNFVPRSPKLESLWARPNPDATDLFRRVLGPSAAPDDAEALKRDRPFLFVGLLTMKLWLDQRR